MVHFFIWAEWVLRNVFFEVNLPALREARVWVLLTTMAYLHYQEETSENVFICLFFLRCSQWIILSRMLNLLCKHKIVRGSNMLKVVMPERICKLCNPLSLMHCSSMMNISAVQAYFLQPQSTRETRGKPEINHSADSLLESSSPSWIWQELMTVTCSFVKQHCTRTTVFICFYSLMFRKLGPRSKTSSLFIFKGYFRSRNPESMVIYHHILQINLNHCNNTWLGSEDGPWLLTAAETRLRAGSCRANLWLW